MTSFRGVRCLRAALDARTSQQDWLPQIRVVARLGLRRQVELGLWVDHQGQSALAGTGFDVHGAAEVVGWMVRPVGKDRRDVWQAVRCRVTGVACGYAYPSRIGCCPLQRTIERLAQPLCAGLCGVLAIG